MKRSLIVSLSALTLSLVTVPAFAKEATAVNQVSTGSIVQITPFNLAYRAYQGSFTNQGIPSNGAFLNAVAARRVTAVDLIEQAIANRRLSPETIEDRAYINSVESHLDTLNND